MKLSVQLMVNPREIASRVIVTYNQQKDVTAGCCYRRRRRPAAYNIVWLTDSSISALPCQLANGLAGLAGLALVALAWVAWGLAGQQFRSMALALSPGMWVLHDKKSPLFSEGRPASSGLEAQAEDGNAGLVVSLEMGHPSPSLHGIFNTPVDTTGRPGADWSRRRIRVCCHLGS